MLASENFCRKSEHLDLIRVSLNLEVRSDNLRAIRLYEKYGFRKLCVFPGFFKIDGKYIDFDLMNLELGYS